MTVCSLKVQCIFPTKSEAYDSYKLTCMYVDFFMLSFDSFSDSDNLESGLLLLWNLFSVLAGC